MELLPSICPSVPAPSPKAQGSHSFYSKPLLEEAGSGLSLAPRYGCDQWSLVMGI